VLCVGTIDRRKNQVSLVRAWIALSRRRPMPLLVLAGRFNGMSDDVRILLEREDCPVKVIEGPSDEDVGALYAACQFTVFPSHFEGWGIPVGESLWFGKACLASNATSIPEVGGPHCRYFDPASLDDLIEKLEGMLDDPPDMSYLTRDQLRTWEQVAQDLRLALFAPPVIPAQAAAPAEPAIPAAPHLVSA
jgi:glycosyltransferase involved in cell wall biosynthesis